MRPLILLLLALVLTSACTAAPASRTLADAQVTKPTPTPTPTPTPIPTPTAPPTPEPLPQGQPFTIGIDEVRVTSGHNGALFGTAPTPPDPAAANQAVDAAAAALVRFLDAQFVARDTYWSDGGVAALLDPASLDPGTREALGVLADGEVLGTVTGSAAAVADVVMDGATLHAVSLSYAATVELILTEGSGPVSHTGVITFTPVQDQLTLTAIQPTTTFGGDLIAVLS